MAPSVNVDMHLDLILMHILWPPNSLYPHTL